MADAPQGIDAAAVRRSFARAAPAYDTAAALQREVAQRMAGRLDYVRIMPQRVVDAGCGTSEDLRLLAARYPKAERVGLDFSLPMLRIARTKAHWFKRLLAPLRAHDPLYICADARALPLATGSAGLVWSNLMLHWLDDPMTALAEMRRVLGTEGLLMFSCLGVDTLRELREAFAMADGADHVHRFLDLHDYGDMLMASGFGDPVMDVERIALTYARPEDLLRDLRASGSVNALPGRKRGLMGRAAWARMLDALASRKRDGRLEVTFEVIYGHAWKPEPRAATNDKRTIRFDRLPR